jgi:predicted enzyme related to lactoylglutathione lyase
LSKYSRLAQVPFKDLVEDIQETLRGINVNGGRTLMPKTGIGEYGFIAHFEDTEGNRHSIHSRM